MENRNELLLQSLGEIDEENGPIATDPEASRNNFLRSLYFSRSVLNSHKKAKTNKTKNVSGFSNEERKASDKDSTLATEKTNKRFREALEERVTQKRRTESVFVKRSKRRFGKLAPTEKRTYKESVKLAQKTAEKLSESGNEEMEVFSQKSDAEETADAFYEENFYQLENTVQGPSDVFAAFNEKNDEREELIKNYENDEERTTPKNGAPKTDVLVGWGKWTSQTSVSVPINVDDKKKEQHRLGLTFLNTTNKNNDAFADDSEPLGLEFNTVKRFESLLQHK